MSNLDNYDVILGTPFLYQHKVAIGLNPPCCGGRIGQTVGNEWAGRHYH